MFLLPSKEFSLQIIFNAGVWSAGAPRACRASRCSGGRGQHKDAQVLPLPSFRSPEHRPREPPPARGKVGRGERPRPGAPGGGPGPVQPRSPRPARRGPPRPGPAGPPPAAAPHGTYSNTCSEVQIFMAAGPLPARPRSGAAAAAARLRGSGSAAGGARLRGQRPPIASRRRADVTGRVPRDRGRARPGTFGVSLGRPRALSLIPGPVRPGLTVKGAPGGGTAGSAAHRTNPGGCGL